jgi:hypothetical protein
MENKMWITYFLRRAFLIAFSCAILSSTVCLGTETILRASLSNAPHPVGLPIESPLAFSHKSSIFDTGNKPVSQTPSEYLRQQQTEAVCVCPLARIESENLLGDIPEQVVRGNANVSVKVRHRKFGPAIANGVPECN